MENNNAGKTQQIEMLRAEAEENLKGNAFYVIAQRLDALLAGGDQGGPDAQAELDEIAAELGVDVTAESAGGADANPIVINTISALRNEAVKKLAGNPFFVISQQLDALLADADAGIDDAAAEATLKSIREQLGMSGSASDSGEAAQSAILEAAQGDDEIVISSPSANSFGTPQSTVAVGYGTRSENDSTLRATVDTMRALADARLSGSQHFEMVSLLSMLRELPQMEPSVVLEPAEDLPEALEQLRHEIDLVTMPAKPEAMRVFGLIEKALETVPHEQTDMPEEIVHRDGGADREYEAEKSGFDRLTEVSWRRVQEVTGIEGDENPAQFVNGQDHDEDAPAPSEASAHAAGDAAVAADAPVEAAVTVEDAPAAVGTTASATPEAVSLGAPPPAGVTQETQPDPSPVEHDMAGAPQLSTEFRVTPGPLIMNRPIRKNPNAKPKRAAKLPHLPKKRS